MHFEITKHYIIRKASVFGEEVLIELLYEEGEHIETSCDLMNYTQMNKLKASVELLA